MLSMLQIEPKCCCGWRSQQQRAGCWAGWSVRTDSTAKALQSEEPHISDLQR